MRAGQGEVENLSRSAKGVRISASVLEATADDLSGRTELHEGRRSSSILPTGRPSPIGIRKFGDPRSSPLRPARPRWRAVGGGVSWWLRRADDTVDAMGISTPEGLGNGGGGGLVEEVLGDLDGRQVGDDDPDGTAKNVTGRGANPSVSLSGLCGMSAPTVTTAITEATSGREGRLLKNATRRCG